jgi:hypothetical protein
MATAVVTVDTREVTWAHTWEGITVVFWLAGTAAWAASGIRAVG